MPQATLVMLSHDDVVHGDAPISTEALTSTTAKFVPRSVRTELPVGGLFGVRSWVTTGESNENVPTDVATAVAKVTWAPKFAPELAMPSKHVTAVAVDQAVVVQSAAPTRLVAV